MQSIGEIIASTYGAKLGERVGEVHKVTCEEHGERDATVVFNAGNKLIYSSCPQCKEIKDKQKQELEQQQKYLAFINRLNNANIPRFYANKTFSSYSVDCQEQALAFNVFLNFAKDFGESLKNGRFLLGFGATGSGKTHLAIAVANYIIVRNSAYYALSSDIIRTIRDTWSRNSEKSETQILNELSTVQLLIIDELGVQYGTESEQNLLFEIINRRILSMNPTIILTNLPPNSENGLNLKCFLGERTYDRLKEVAMSVKFNWESHRGQK